MAENVSQQLARVTVKSQMLLERYRVLSTSYEQSLDRIAELEQELRRRRDTIDELKRELSYTKAAATISASSPGMWPTPKSCLPRFYAKSTHASPG